MSTPTFRPVRAICPHVRDLVDAALTDDGALVFRSAALAHLAVQTGIWRVRHGVSAWEQAGPDGQWTPIPSVVVDGVTWYSLDPRWGWRSVLPVPSPRPEDAPPLVVRRPTPTGIPGPGGSRENGADTGAGSPGARPGPTTESAGTSAGPNPSATGRTRSRTEPGERPLLQVVADLTG